MTKPTASFGTLLGVLLLFVACGDAQRPRLPVGPTPPPSAAPPPPPPALPPAGSGWLWGMVINSSGGCIEGATVEVVAGQRLGEKLTQQTPCGAWDYAGGFYFPDLVPNVEMRLRGSAPGWTSEEKTFTPSVGFGTAVFLNLSPLRTDQ